MQTTDSSLELDRAQSTSASPTPLPAQLESPVAKLVYLYLSSVGPASVDELATVLRLRKLTVYPVLDHLWSRGLLTRRGQLYRT